MNLHHLTSQKNEEETVEFLEHLLVQAKKGHVAGIVFCVELKGDHHAVGAVGIYARNHTHALAACSRLSHWMHGIAGPPTGSSPISNYFHYMENGGG